MLDVDTTKEDVNTNFRQIINSKKISDFLDYTNTNKLVSDRIRIPLNPLLYEQFIYGDYVTYISHLSRCYLLYENIITYKDIGFKQFLDSSIHINDLDITLLTNITKDTNLKIKDFISIERFKELIIKKLTEKLNKYIFKYFLIFLKNIRDESHIKAIYGEYMAYIKSHKKTF